MTDLRKLIEAVEGATDNGNSAALINNRIASMSRNNGQYWPSRDVMKAFDGSLDAAKALHEALLQGYDYVLSHTNGGLTIHADVGGEADAFADNPARAWLLAILKAYEAQQ